MLLGRLRIRGKLTLLVLVPLLATIAVTGSNAVELFEKASRAQETASAVRLARLTAELIRELQLERLFSVGLLKHNVDRSRLSLQNANVAEKQANLRRLGPDLPPSIVSVLDRVAVMSKTRDAALVGAASPQTILTSYSSAITGLLDAMRLLDAVDGDTTQGREVIALDAAMRVNEGFSALLAAMAVVNTPSELAPFTPSVALIRPAANRFNSYATPEQLELFGNSIAAVDARLGQNFAVGMVTNPSGVAQLKALPSFAAIYSLTGVGRFVETKVINDALLATAESARLEATQAVSFGALSGATILIVVMLGVAVGRSVAVPLRRLTQSADRVARLAESELVRVADNDSPSTEPARLRPIDVAGRDELGDLARAFGRVQETAARLVERQVAGRRNVAQMFGHVGRRTQNLVGRQIALIDKLENDETDPGRLSELYRLDHMSSRLRRNASSLVVLSGVSGADEHIMPVALGDVTRLALAEIEDYARVDVEVSTSVRVAPALINDLVLLLAELMENATAFSPPGTSVTVTALMLGERARLTVVDHGLGMSTDRLAKENSRLTHRERLDLAPTEVLGLFVVGRLARRHRLDVSLLSTEGGGVTAVVEIPAHLLTASVATPVLPAAASPPSDAEADSQSDSRPVVPAQRRGDVLAAAAADPAMVVVGAFDRAADSLEAAEPWNAFVAGDAELETAGEVARAGLAEGERPTVEMPTAGISPAGLPTAGIPPVSVPMAVNGAQRRFEPVAPGAPARASTLHRRAPGATLGSLEAQVASWRSAQGRPGLADAEQARDNLADFESGVARAMSEVVRIEEEGS